ncbi:hypothetical protein [Winogradskyella psychrotolerans]|uniref:hypothetical protein n=1 Tax=Winogradskyella psychrotolerans TaxID=1344585 RepID=UPI001C06D174|nr:hypothetical protein [Winogradskyella psychrotolerans]MBU2926620.1 hypothetical protein [Winogradskyella psychrotolerans]
MEVLKLKIFDVLVNNITIEEFENWLYNSKLLEEKLKEDSLIFEIVNINYRLDNSMKMLKNIAYNIFDEDDFLVMKIEENCKKIVNTDDPKSIEKYVLNIVQDYNFDSESNVYWEFYNLHYSLDGYDYMNYSKGSIDKLNTKTIEYAKSVLNILNKCKNIEEKKQVRIMKIDSEKVIYYSSPIVAKTKNISLKNRLFSFFRK